MPWVYLLIAGLFEVTFTTCLKLSEGFTKLWPSLGFFVASVTSFIFLNFAIKTIPIGTAYAIWTGIGAAGTATIGILWFKEPATAARLAFLILLIGSVIGLKLVTK